MGGTSQRQSFALACLSLPEAVAPVGDAACIFTNCDRLVNDHKQKEQIGRGAFCEDVDFCS